MYTYLCGTVFWQNERNRERETGRARQRERQKERQIYNLRSFWRKKLIFIDLFCKRARVITHSRVRHNLAWVWSVTHYRDITIEDWVQTSPSRTGSSHLNIAVWEKSPSRTGTSHLNIAEWMSLVSHELNESCLSRTRSAKTYGEITIEGFRWVGHH